MEGESKKVESKALGRCRKAGQRFGVYCSAMSQAMAVQTENGKGISECVGFVDGVDGAALLGVVYRTSAHRTGMLFNACPWCNESLKWWPEAAMKPVDEVASHG